MPKNNGVVWSRLQLDVEDDASAAQDSVAEELVKDPPHRADKALRGVGV